MTDPAPGPGEILVRVESCGVNYPDVLIIEDRYQARPPRPFAPGGEIAGIVEALGAEVTAPGVGERVAALVYHGGMVEKLVLRAEGAVVLPKGMPGPIGAMLLTTYATSYHALVDRGGLRAGETLLVLGASGGVGLAAVEIGKALGAHVVAAASSAEKAAVARRAGADDTLVYGADPLDRDGQREFADRLKTVLGTRGAGT